jgi:tripartite-type tricarboxylate transporter receptor subunit TctC
MRFFSWGAVLTAALACLPGALLAQSAATQTIRLIVPFTPGGGTDTVARLIADKITQSDPSTPKRWLFVIDNKPGASGNIAMDMLAKAKPDGLTLAMGQTATLAINPALFAKLPFNASHDFVPVALVATQPMVLVVRSEAAYKDLGGLVQAAKAAPGKLTQALAGTGTVGHLAGELFARQAGLSFVNVPYKGAAPALQDLMGGQTDFMLTTPQAALGLIKGGKLRALAVTSAKRLPVLPDVPTVNESGYAGFEAADWKALVAPKGTPAAMIKQLNAAVERALGQTSTLAQLLADGSAPMKGPPDDVLRYVKAEQARWGAAVRAANVSSD